MTVGPEMRLVLPGIEATESLGRVLALWARPGFVIALTGDLGSGKTVLARAFILSMMKSSERDDVPSPSFAMVQTYDNTRMPVFHADLYRMKTDAELEELGLGELLETHCGIVEWAEKLPRPLTENTLVICLAGSGESREARLTAHGAWVEALRRNQQIARFLGQEEFAGRERVFLEGDASSRRYEVVVQEGKSVLLMDMPTRPDGPPVKDGKPYSAIAHLAEDISAVIAINNYLVGLGYSAPRTIKADLDAGLALVEPLGEQVYGRMALAGVDMREPLETAAAVLADMAGRHWPQVVPADDSRQHRLKPYDVDAMLIEVDLLPTWFVPHVRGQPLKPGVAVEFSELWHDLLPLVTRDRSVWTLRDYHSPNLIWIPERDGLRRVGIIDTQDAVLGHPAYDLVSMCQDARVDISPDMEAHIFAHYCALRAKLTTFDEEAFKSAYAVLGAQRASKILGIFARLSKRDGKHAYLNHIPRVSAYLSRNLAHPALAALRAWYQRHVPEALGCGGS